jgi:hypothetical protein
MARNKKKAKIPKALREQVWRTVCKDAFEAKCPIKWCQNRITVFDFEVGHNIPESKGGTLDIHNLRPICGRCNCSMSNNYTIDEWNTLGNQSKKKEKKENKLINQDSSNGVTLADCCCCLSVFWL